MFSWLLDAVFWFWEVAIGHWKVFLGCSFLWIAFGIFRGLSLWLLLAPLYFAGFLVLAPAIIIIPAAFIDAAVEKHAEY